MKIAIYTILNSALLLLLSYFISKFVIVSSTGTQVGLFVCLVFVSTSRTKFRVGRGTRACELEPDEYVVTPAQTWLKLQQLPQLPVDGPTHVTVDVVSSDCTAIADLTPLLPEEYSMVWRPKQNRWIPKRWLTTTAGNSDTPFCVGQRVKFAEGSSVFTGVIAEVHGGSAPDSKAMPKYVVQCDDGDEATKVHRSIIPFTLSQATTVTVSKTSTPSATKSEPRGVPATTNTKKVGKNGSAATSGENSKNKTRTKTKTRSDVSRPAPCHLIAHLPGTHLHTAPEKHQCHPRAAIEVRVITTDRTHLRPSLRSDTNLHSRRTLVRVRVRGLVPAGQYR